jgi:pyridoxamine 5'-phosphate oxidase
LEAIVAPVIDDRVMRIRRDYESAGLIESEMAPDPFAQFEEWFDGVLAAGLDEPNAMVLATATQDGRPSARAVLMKGFSSAGVVFYTNMESRKSVEMFANPRAALVFVWTPIHRQVRFEGDVQPVDDASADLYFATRPRGSQLAAHASPQSKSVESRSVLDRSYAELDARFTGDVPRPANWGGWRLQPEAVEFWQGQPNRFHDRIRYEREAEGWVMTRLAP